jgi:hypothetical protein
MYPRRRREGDSARGYLGKAMFVAIDKAIALRTYDRVQKKKTGNSPSRLSER